MANNNFSMTMTGSLSWATADNLVALNKTAADRVAARKLPARITAVGTYTLEPATHMPDGAPPMTSFANALAQLHYLETKTTIADDGTEKHRHTIKTIHITDDMFLNGYAENHRDVTGTTISTDLLDMAKTAWNMKIAAAANALQDAAGAYFSSESINGNNAKIRAAKEALRRVFDMLESATGYPHKLQVTNKDIKHIIAFSWTKKRVGGRIDAEPGTPEYEAAMYSMLVNQQTAYAITPASLKRGVYEWLHCLLLKKPLPKFSETAAGTHAKQIGDDSDWYITATKTQLAERALEQKQTRDLAAARDLPSPDDTAADVAADAAEAEAEEADAVADAVNAEQDTADETDEMAEAVAC